MARDPINAAIYEGIKRGIQLCLDNKCFGSAVVLTYSGIDSMAFLAMPEKQVNVTRTDFIAWCENYIRFPCKAQLTGADLYGARCGMLHTFGVESNVTRAKQGRMIAYMDHGVPEVRYNPAVADDMVMVSILALAESFYRGVDRFLVDLFADQSRELVVKSRLDKLVVCFPVGQSP
jgi:hypothetical protein